MASKKDKKPTASTVKKRAGLLLNTFLREIAEEETEFLKDDDDGDRMVTKAEALARMIWDRALGFEEKRMEKDKEVTIEHPPDKFYVGILFDRIEGRAAPVSYGGKKQRTIADKVGEQSKKRINNIAKKSIE
jgi:hypothetical protein